MVITAENTPLIMIVSAGSVYRFFNSDFEVIRGFRHFSHKKFVELVIPSYGFREAHVLNTDPSIA